MTRKYFEIIAASLKEQDASYKTCCQVCSALIKCNENFDYNRFMKACGMKDWQ